MKILYTLIIYGYWITIRLAAWIDPKAKKWVKGRKDMWQQMKGKAPISQSIWVHCASLGEFEQARPVIEAIKKRYPLQKISLSFFSPSGYEIRQDYSNADQVFYLPIDLPGRMRSFIDLLNPKMVIFVKYEFWFNCLDILQKKGINYVFISALFRKRQFFFYPGMGRMARLLRQADRIFVQDQASADILARHTFKNVSYGGDTRVDRVLDMKAKVQDIPGLTAFKGEQKLWICASIHTADFRMLLPAMQTWASQNKLVIVPHEVDQPFIKNIQDAFNAPVLYSEWRDKDRPLQTECLIIDRVGLLSRLYPYADLVYVGGGFGKGIHNILEPAVFEKTILIGPKYQKFQEAVILAQQRGIRTFGSREALSDLLDEFENDPAQFVDRQAVRQYFVSQQGATRRVMGYLSSCLSSEI